MRQGTNTAVVDPVKVLWRSFIGATRRLRTEFGALQQEYCVRHPITPIHCRKRTADSLNPFESYVGWTAGLAGSGCSQRMAAASRTRLMEGTRAASPRSQDDDALRGKIGDSLGFGAIASIPYHSPAGSFDFLSRPGTLVPLSTTAYWKRRASGRRYLLAWFSLSSTRNRAALRKDPERSRHPMYRSVEPCDGANTYQGVGFSIDGNLPIPWQFEIGQEFRLSN